MSKFAKLLVTIGVLFVFFMLFAVIVGARGDAGHSTPGIFFGLILFAAVIGAIRAIWKSDKKDEKDNEGMLQK